MFKNAIFKNYSKKMLRGRWSIPVLVTLIMLGVSFFYAQFSIRFQLVKVGESYRLLPVGLAAISYGVAIVGFIVVSLFVMIFNFAELAFYKNFRNLSQGVEKENPEPVTIIHFFSKLKLWKKALLGYLWQALWLCIWGLIFFVPVFSIAFGVVYAIFQTSVPEMNFHLAIFIPFLSTIIFMFAFLIPAMIKYYSYSQMMLIIADNPNVSIRKAMKMSKKMTKSYRGNLFVLDLSFLGWEILSVLTFGILNLYVIPYRRLTSVNVFYFLKNKALENGVLFASDFGEPEVLIESMPKIEASQETFISETSQEE